MYVCMHVLDVNVVLTVGYNQKQAKSTGLDEWFLRVLWALTLPHVCIWELSDPPCSAVYW